jgi:uncharacterized integral membrane protein (TIGR00698 family)
MLALYILPAIVVLALGIPAHWALVMGLMMGFVWPLKDHQPRIKRYSSRLLVVSVALLGAGLSLKTMGHYTVSGAPLTMIGLALTFILGAMFGKLFQIESTQKWLMTAGTGICGGSAIATLAPVLGASSVAIAVAMTVVFVFNALAVYIFPPIGVWLAMSSEQFGQWCALAIHDTSSVIAAASLYDAKALEVATVTKLTRALWIIPLALVFTFLGAKKSGQRFQIPWVIVWFIGVSALFTYTPLLHVFRPEISQLARRGFAATLFLIGLQIDREALRTVGWRPFAFGATLWILTTVMALGLVTFYTPDLP